MSKGDPLEPNRSFNSARLKVRWAEYHINNLAKIETEFIRKQNESSGIAPDQLGFMHYEQIHPFFALHAGDAIFSLRSALDCCWMGLERSLDAGADKGTLPRCDTLDELKKSPKMKILERRLEGLEKFICEIVRPFKAGHEEIWFAGKIDNWNKHNMIVLTSHRTELQSAVFQNVEGGTFQFRNCVFEGHAPGGLIGSDRPLSLALNNAVRFTTEIVLVSIKPPNERPLMPFLSVLLETTDKVVEAFVARFGKPND